MLRNFAGSFSYSSWFLLGWIQFNRERVFAECADYDACVSLPLSAPILPMLAKRVAEIPVGDDWIFEPKWDGFRCLVFRGGDEILLQSRDGKPLNRYFPDVVKVLLEQLPERCVLDGELVIATKEGLDFDALQLRIHPAASQIGRAHV